MSKIALFAVIVVLSLGFVGCASSLENDWGLKEEGDGYLSHLNIDLAELGRREPYCVTIIYCGKEGKARVSYEIYHKLTAGQSVKLKLACAVMKDESDKKGERFCDATYHWWIPGLTEDENRLITFKLP